MGVRPGTMLILVFLIVSHDHPSNLTHLQEEGPGDVTQPKENPYEELVHYDCFRILPLDDT